MMLLEINSMFEIIMSQKVKAVAMIVVMAFAIAGLTAVTSLSDSLVIAQCVGNLSDSSVVAELSGLNKHPHRPPGNVSDSSVVSQNQDNDPNNCFRTNNNIDTCPM